MNSVKKAIVRISPVTVVIFSVMFSPLIIIGIAKAFGPHQFEQGLLFCGLYVFAVFWACSPRVYVDGKTLKYRTLFTNRSVDLETVTRVEVTARPTPVLKLYQTDHSQPFQFIVKPFSKVGVSFIMRYVRLAAPNARFSTISSDLERGDFASVTREALQVHNWLRFFITLVGIALLLALLRAFQH